LNGGGGNDTASYTTSSADITANLELGSATGEGTDVLISIENLQGGSGRDTLTGNSGANRLDGGLGADTMAGGKGDDTYVVDNTGDVVKEEDGEGTDTVESSLTTYTLGNNLEKLILKEGSGNINGTGNGLANTLTGNSGANRLDGGLGADTMAGGAGDDTYVVDNTGDVVTEASGAGTDTIETSVSYTLNANVEKLILKEGFGNIDGTAKDDNNDNNTLTGNTGNNKLSGGGGNDTLIGGEGNDSLIGGKGNDSLQGGAGNDTLIGGDDNDTLDLRTNNTSLVGDKAEGGEGNDTVIISQSALGASGVNLDGGAGNDTLRVFRGSALADLNLSDLNAKNFETLDLRTDTNVNNLVLSSQGIQKLLMDSHSNKLTLLMGNNDTYSIETESNETVTQGKFVSFYNQSNTLIAQVELSYA